MPSSMATPSPTPSPLSPAVPLTCPLSSLPASPLAWDLAAWWAGEGWGLRGCASARAVPAAARQRPWGTVGRERGRAGRRRVMAPGRPAGARNPALAPHTQSSSQSPGSATGRGETVGGSSLPLPRERKERPGTCLAAVIGMGETEAWDGSVRERGAARVSRRCQAGTRLVCRHGARQGRRVTGVPARGGGIATAARAQGQGRNGCPSRAWASLIHSPGCPWKCQGVPLGEGQRAACQNRRAPRGSLCWRGGGGAGRGRHWERVPVPPAASQRPHMCAGSALHKGGSEALRSRGLAPA